MEIGNHGLKFLAPRTIDLIEFRNIDKRRSIEFYFFFKNGLSIDTIFAGSLDAC